MSSGKIVASEEEKRSSGSWESEDSRILSVSIEAVSMIVLGRDASYDGGWGPLLWL